MSESVGKISLDLEVKSDLMNEINAASSKVGNRLKEILNKTFRKSLSGVGKSTESAMKSVEKTIEGTMKRATGNVNKSTKSMMKNTTDMIKSTFQDAGDVAKNTLGKIGEKTRNLSRSILESFRMRSRTEAPDNDETVVQKASSKISPITVPRAPPTLNIDRVTSQMETIERTMDNVENKIKSHKQKLRGLRESYSQAFNPDVKDTLNDKILKEEAAINSLVGKMDSLSAKYEKLEGQTRAFSQIQNASVVATKAATSSISDMSSVLNRFHSTGKKTQPVLSRIGNGLRSIGKQSKSANVNVRSFGGGIGNTLGQMMKWMIILPGIASGIKAFGSSLLASLNTNDQFVASLNLIKSNLMVAFTPIYNAILPAINALMSSIATATSYLASFISLLFGKSFQQSFESTKSLVAAKDAMGAYGSAAKKAGKDATAAGKAAKDAGRDILGFDKIEKLSDDPGSDDGSGGAGDSNAPVLVQPPNMDVLDAATMPWVKKFKDIMSKIFQPFKEAWALEGQSTIASMKYALSSIWELVKSIGHSFLEVWNNGAGTLMLSNILVIFQNIFKTIGNISGGLQEAWEKNNTGTQIIQSIFNIFNTVLGTIRNITGATAEWARKLDFTPLLSSISRLLKALEPLTAHIGDGLEWFWNNVLLPIAGWTIETAVPVFLDMLSVAINALSEVISAIQPLGAWLFDSFLGPLAEFTGGLFISAMKTITGLLKTFSEWCATHQETIRVITVAVAGFFAAWKVIEILSFIQQSGGVISALGQITTALLGATAAKLADKAETIILTAMYAKDFVVGLAKGTVELVKQAAQFAIMTGAKIADTVAQAALTVATAAWNVVCGIATAATAALGAAFTFLTGPIGIVILVIGAVIAIGVLLYKNWDTIKAKAKDVWDFVKQKFNEFREFMSGIFTRDWSKDFGIIGQVLNGFFKTVSDIWQSVKKIFSGIIDFVAGVFTGNWRRAWDGIKNIFKGVFEGMASIVKKPVNAIITLLNGLISGVSKAVNTVAKMFNNLKVKIPSWVPGIGGKSLGFNIPTWNPSKIPYLAKGGVINQPTLAMMGEDGEEAVVPLEHNREWVKRVSDEMQKQQATSGNVSSPEIVAMMKKIVTLMENFDIVKLDEESVRKYFIKATNKNTKATGRCELLT